MRHGGSWRDRAGPIADTAQPGAGYSGGYRGHFLRFVPGTSFFVPFSSGQVWVDLFRSALWVTFVSHFFMTKSDEIFSDLFSYIVPYPMGQYWLLWQVVDCSTMPHTSEKSFLPYDSSRGGEKFIFDSAGTK